MTRNGPWSMPIPYAVILLRNAPENQNIIKKFRITPENIGEKISGLLNSANAAEQMVAADIFNLIGRGDLAMLAFSKILFNEPENGRVWLVMGEMEAKKKDPQSAITAIVYIRNAIFLGETALKPTPTSARRTFWPASMMMLETL